MKPSNSIFIGLVLTFLSSAMVCTVTYSQESPPNIPGPTKQGRVPDLTKGEGPAVNKAKPDFYLHCGDVRGWAWQDKDGKCDSARQILITKVPHHDPTASVLKRGDVILGVNGKYFSKNPIHEFRGGSIPAKKTKKPFEVILWRKGWKQAKKIVVDQSIKNPSYMIPDIPGLTAKGKRSAKPVPDFTKGGKKDDKHDWNLGPTGARGWMWGMRLRTDLARQILITKVEKGSPADGILKPGDVILGIGGKKFDSDARIAFGNAITEAEKEKNKGILKLTRWRNGKTETVDINIGVMGTYGPLAPMNCPKSKKILEKACRYIAKKKIGEGIPGYVNALGLLASGDPQYLPMVRDYARNLKVEDAKAMSSWNMAYMNIFLAEYYLLTGDKEVFPKIREMALYLANGQSRVGTWGHGNAGPDGIILGYGAMCQPSLSCAVSLILDQKCGIDEPVVEKAIRKSETFFTTFVNRGNIPYGDGTPRQVHDSNGRSSWAAVLYDLLDNPEAYAFYARMTIASYGQREEGHTGNYWGMLAGPLGAMRAGPEAAAAFLREQQWFFDLERRWDGGFTYQGGAAMSGAEHTTPGWDTTGARALMYAMSLQKLYLTGKGLKKEKFLKGKELADTLEAGKGYNIWLREGYIDADPWDSLSSDELFKKLVTWSFPQRIRAAKALARKKDEDHVPVLTQMLKSKDRDVILGGICGLEYQREKAEPAADALISLLKNNDLWIRFQAGCALCAIGEKVRVKAATAALKAAAEDMPNDPRDMNQTFMCFVLFGDGLNGSPKGLLRSSTKGVDNALIVAAIKKIITNENGQTRSYVARAVNKMSFEELSPIWEDLVWAMKNPAPSGIMFNADIREASMNLLGKYRFKEAVPLCAEYIRNMKQHGSQKRITRIMKVLTSYGTEAKSVLPQLYETRKYYKKNWGPGKPMHFPQWATDKFFDGFDTGVKTIEESTDKPTDLRSLQDFLNSPKKDK